MEQPHLTEFNQARPDKSSPYLCHAPFKSIFFGMRGNLMTCCFNRMYNLGTYPEKSIKEIWFGEKADTLREAIKKNDLSLGCQLCGHMLAAKNFEGIPIKNFDYIGWDKEGYPTKMDFELSNTCNLECIMCRGELSSSIRQNREKKPPIPMSYDDEFIRQLEEFIPHLQNSHFLGGEPFLIPIYLDIWEKMIELNPKISISVQTNATVLNERIKKILEAMPFSISVSIDSIEKETYEQIRVNANFERVMENILFFKEHCSRKGKKLTISYCPMIQNWRELPRVVEFCNGLNADVFFNTVVLPVKCSLNYLPVAELADVISFLEQHQPALPTESEVQRFNKKGYEGVMNQLKYFHSQALIREKNFGGRTVVKDIDEYLKVLKKSVESYPHTHNKSAMYFDMEEKIKLLLQQAEEESLRDDVQAFLCSLDPVTVCDHFPTIEKEQIYTLVKLHAGL